MKQNTEDFHWIIMADIIDSGQNEPILLQNHFKNCVEIANKKFKKSIVSPLTITLGDEFQGLIGSLKKCIEIIIFIEEFIIENNLEFKLRFVINYGKIETQINTEIAYGMLGEGLTKARELINNLKKADSRFNFEIGKPDKSQALSAAFMVFDNIVAKWRYPDDKTMATQFIIHKDYKIIAEKLGKPRSQVWKRKHSLEINSYFAIKNLIRYIV